MSSVSFDGKVSLTFTNEMIVPSNFITILNDRNETEAYTFVSKEEARRLAEKATKKDYLQLVMLRSESGDTQRGNLTNWTVSEASSKEIKIVLVFDQPLHVSQGEEPDQLLVVLNLDSFPDIYGRHLSPGLLKIKAIPPQASSSEAGTI